MDEKIAAPRFAEPQESPNPVDVRETHGITAPPSSTEAVRQALTAGVEGPHEGTAYIRQKFGIEITPSHFLAVKATERKKGWAKNGKPGRKPKQTSEGGRVKTPREQSADGGGEQME